MIKKREGSLPITVSENIIVASTLGQRARGLLGRTIMPEDMAMLFPYTNVVHTIGMKFAIDCIFTNYKQEIVKIASNVTPFRFAGVWNLFSNTIEIKSGNAAKWDLRIGDILYVDS